MKILPAIAQTPNGNLAVLSWTGSVDPQLLQAIQSGEDLKHFTIIGALPTQHGTLGWLFSVVDTKTNFANLTAELFYFDYVLNPAELQNEPIHQTWLQCLRSQDQLRLEIPHGNKVRSTIILRDEQLREYVTLLDRSISNWQPQHNDYAKAVQQMPIEQLIQRAYDYIDATERPQTPKERLLQNLIEACKATLPATETLRVWAVENRTRSIQALLEERNRQQSDWNQLSDTAPEEGENLIRDWLYVTHCIEHSPNKPHYAIGLSEDQDWAWRKLPNNCDFDTLWTLARSYRSLLFTRHWRSLVENQDLPLPNLNVAYIAELGVVPDRKVFGETSRILKQAILQKQFGIAPKTTIVVDKPGFDSVSFYPLDRESRRCIFKVVVAPKNRNEQNFCLFGKLDAALGEIEALGIYPTAQTEKPLQLLLFLVTVAYRDCVVARSALSPRVSVSKTAQKRTQKREKQKSSLTLLARTKGTINSSFADPNRFVERLKQIAPAFRVEHSRLLPPGWKPSQRQIELAKQYGMFLPEGFTFVSPTNTEDIDEAAVQKFRSRSLLQLLFE